MAIRNRKRNVNGILLIDKRIHQSSNQTLQAAKNIYQANKAGHSGTLDVLASGLLPICFGEATKVSQYLLRERKSYLCRFAFGMTTGTGDLEGDVLSRHRTDFLSEELVIKATENFLGRILQVPPMYSALKRKGVPLYKLARRGLEVQREAREVEIYRFDMLGFSKFSARFNIECSKGTYIRKLAEDLGEELGCGACVAALRREHVGMYEVGQAHSLTDLKYIFDSQDFAGLDSLLLPIDGALSGLPSVSVSSEQRIKLEMGQQVIANENNLSGVARLYDAEGNFFGIGERLATGFLAARRMIKGAVDAE